MTIICNKWNRKEVKKVDPKTITTPSHNPFKNITTRSNAVKTLRGTRK